MSRIFIILLPSMLPTISFPLPANASITVTASSGAEVPSATTVTPIIKVEILSFFAIPDAPSTKKSAPFTKRTKPKSNKNTFKTISPAILHLFIFCATHRAFILI